VSFTRWLAGKWKLVMLCGLVQIGGACSDSSTEPVAFRVVITPEFSSVLGERENTPDGLIALCTYDLTATLSSDATVEWLRGWNEFHYTGFPPSTGQMSKEAATAFWRTSSSSARTLLARFQWSAPDQLTPARGFFWFIYKASNSSVDSAGFSVECR
jgi:hypothetical protein